MNEFVLKSHLLTELMAEINKIQPHLETCLAPKTNRKKQGASALRTGDISSTPSAPARSQEDLAASAKALYEWLGPEKNRIRMLMTFQAQGGLSFVALAHHKCAQAFRNNGNAAHTQENRNPEVTLKEFQEVTP